MGIIRNQLFEKQKKTKTSFHSKKRLKEFKRQKKKNIHITYELAKL